MLPTSNPDRIDIAFDADRLVADAVTGPPLRDHRL